MYLLQNKRESSLLLKTFYTVFTKHSIVSGFSLTSDTDGGPTIGGPPNWGDSSIVHHMSRVDSILAEDSLGYCAHFLIEFHLRSGSGFSQIEFTGFSILYGQQK